MKKFMKSIILISACTILGIALAGCSTLIQQSSQHISAPPPQKRTQTGNHTQSTNTTLLNTDSTPETAKPPISSTQSAQHVIETSRGLVWNPSPLMNNNGSAVPSLVTPFTLYLSPNNTEELQTSSAEKILTLPLKENTPAGQFYVYLDDYFSSENWLVYSIYLMNPGMAQAYTDQLRAVNLDDKKDILITGFHDAGGDHFSVASDKDLILFSQKTPGSGAAYLEQAYIFNLSNGQKEQVDPKSLKTVPGKNTVEYSKDSQALTFQLQLRSDTFAFQ